MHEIFKPIHDFEIKYAVSNLGHIKSFNYRGTGKERVLKPIVSNNGYETVIFYINSKAKRLYVHRLVAIEFLNNPDNLKEVNHIDGNKRNNNVNNLEWCTSKQNHIHGIVTGLYDNMLKAVAKQRKPFLGRNLVTGEIIKFLSLREAAIYVNGNKANISKVLHGKGNIVKGFTFSYLKGGEGYA